MVDYTLNCETGHVGLEGGPIGEPRPFVPFVMFGTGLEVLVNWPAIEVAAQGDDPGGRALALVLLAVRDGTWKPLSG